MRLLTALLLAGLVALSVCQIPQGLDMATQVKLKRKGQLCMRRHLPVDPYAAQLQQQLAVCFDPRCGNQIIGQVMSSYPAYVPQLRQCLGY